MEIRMVSCMYLGVLLSTLAMVASQTVVQYLPGYPGILPFKLETGYIGVGEDEVVQLFYYFVESEGNPAQDPLVIWLNGGPGCSTLRSFFYEIGPLLFEYGKYVDDVPLLKLDPNSWTKVANIIYLDSPTMTGFSYTTIPDIVTNDTLSASNTAEFLRKFVRDHPKFLNNPMYVTGISYSGIVVPIITEEIYKGLISYELYEATKSNCHDEYVQANPNDLLCMKNIEEVNRRVMDINLQHILVPDCEEEVSDIIKAGNPIRPTKRELIGYEPIRMLKAKTSRNMTFCPDYYYSYAGIWANNKKVMKALNIREGTIKEWSLRNTNMTYRYNEAVAGYEFNVNDSVVYHAKLTKRDCRALIFSGDHDMVVPYIGTHYWIRSLNLTNTDSNWETWYVKDQVGGYKTSYARDNYSLLFATVKGAGHTTPEYKHEECFTMVKRWFAHRPI
ncbi:Peptidase S10, serine carboxypeptidase [Cynara cardunculus var. scolymus]|uniref:Peptidase S10, serine carboxypeptidase n=1 Tax=Cynara cardunculus var. scolymus TaxID=59895 RepID=A0A124SF28_CYNCS|nr:Peptidase S10, serine carboxypeptidase [Cynara cardunculus var. scolymus]